MASNQITYQIDVQATTAVANVNAVTTAVTHLTSALQTATTSLTTLLSHQATALTTAASSASSATASQLISQRQAAASALQSQKSADALTLIQAKVTADAQKSIAAQNLVELRATASDLIALQRSTNAQILADLKASHAAQAQAQKSASALALQEARTVAEGQKAAAASALAAQKSTDAQRLAELKTNAAAAAAATKQSNTITNSGQKTVDTMVLQHAKDVAAAQLQAAKASAALALQTAKTNDALRIQAEYFRLAGQAAATAAASHDSHNQSTLGMMATYRLLNVAIESVISALASIPSTGQMFEQINSTLSAIFVTSKSVNEQFKFLNDLSDKTGARLAPLAETYSKFASSAIIAGESLANVQSIFQNLTEAGTVLHLPADKLKSALTAIDQMYGKGAVQLEELKRQLGNQLPAAVSVFARSMGVSTAELMKMTKAGIVVPKETIASFAEMYKTIFAPPEAFDKAASGMNATMGRLETAWTRLAGTIYEAISPALLETLKGATSALNGMRSAIEWLDKDTIKFGQTSLSVFDILKSGWTGVKESALEYQKILSSSVMGDILNTSQAHFGGLVNLVAGESAPIQTRSTPTLSQAISASTFDKFKSGATAGLGNVLYDILNPEGEEGLNTRVEKTITSSAVIARAIATKEAEKAAAAQKAIQESVLAEQRKALLADPTTENSADLSAKAIAKSLELAGKVGQASIAQTASTARHEMAVLEAQKAAIDRQWQNNQLSIADYYAKQLDLANKLEMVEVRKLERQIAIQTALQAQTREAESQLTVTESHTSQISKLKDTIALTALAVAHGGMVIADRSPSNAPSRAVLADLQKTRDTYNATAGSAAIPAGTPLIFYALEQAAATKKLVTLQEQQVKLQTAVISGGKGTESVQSLITSAAAKYNVPANFALAIAKQESGFHQYGKGGGVLTSSSGAHGVMQLMPATGRAYGAGDGSDTGLNVDAGVRYLAKLLKQFNGRTDLAAAAYNSGENRASLRAGQIPNIPETRNYVRSVMGMLGQTLGTGKAVLAAGGSSGLASATSSDLTASMQIATLQDGILAAKEKHALAVADLAARQAEAETQFLKSLEQSNLEYQKLVGHSEAATASAEIELQTRDRLERLQLELNSAIASGNSDQKIRVMAVMEELAATKAITLARAEMKDLQSAQSSMSSWLGIASVKAGDTELSAAYRKQQMARSVADPTLANLQSQMSLVKADVTLSPEAKTTQLAQLLQQMEELRAATESVATLFQDKLTPIISESFTSWVDGSASATDALKSLGMSFTQMIQKMIIDELALQASKAVVSAGSSIASSLMGMFASGGSVPSYATGGVHGSGTGLSDSILTSIPSGSFVLKASSANAIGHSTLAAVSNGEFIVPPAATSHYGSGFWASANRTGRIPGFATGGGVGVGSSMSTSAAPGSVVYNMPIHVSHTGNESSDALAEKISTATVRAIAQAEAERVTRVNNKQRDMSRKRGG